MADLLPGSSGSSPYSFTGYGDDVIFTADDGTHGYEVFIYGAPLPDSTVSISILGRKAAVGKKGFAAIRLACPAQEESGPCKVALSLKTKKKVRFKGRKRFVTVSKKTITVAAGKTGTAKMRINNPVKALLRSSAAARKVTAIAKVSDKAGNRATVRKAYGLGRPAR